MKTFPFNKPFQTGSFPVKHVWAEGAPVIHKTVGPPKPRPYVAWCVSPSSTKCVGSKSKRYELVGGGGGSRLAPALGGGVRKSEWFLYSRKSVGTEYLVQIHPELSELWTLECTVKQTHTLLNQPTTSNESTLPSPLSNVINYDFDQRLVCRRDINLGIRMCHSWRETHSVIDERAKKIRVDAMSLGRRRRQAAVTVSRCPSTRRHSEDGLTVHR